MDQPNQKVLKHYLPTHMIHWDLTKVQLKFTKFGLLNEWLDIPKAWGGGVWAN